MKNPVKFLLFIGMIMAMMLVIFAPAMAATGDPVLINEILASHSGTDDTEFVEFYGIPGTSLDGLSFIVVESDAFGPGTIDRRFDFKPFHKIGPNGFFLFGNCGGLGVNYGVTPDVSLFSNYFENSSLTAALVETDSITGGSVSGSEVVLSTIALTDGDAGDQFFFGAPVIGPDGPFFPAGARRLVDGVDTGSTADWDIASFSLPGANTPTGGGFDGCAPITLTIPEIQGDGRRSIYEGEVVTTTGVVTLYSANGRDFWMQDPNGDGNPATSDGIVVDDGGFLPGPPQVGDMIEITAVVDEQQFGTSLPLTRLDSPSAVTILSSGHDQPEPVPLVDLPNFAIPDGEAFWEPLEGMLVSVDNAPVSAATNGFGEFGMLLKPDAKPGSGFAADTQQILVVDQGDEEVDYNPERVMVDDTSLAKAINVKPGDRVRSLVGVVDYTFSNYKLQPVPEQYDIKVNPRTAGNGRSGGFGNVTITTFNVENLFDLVDNPDKDDGGSTPDPEELNTKLAKLALAIEDEMLLPDIVVLQEVENTELLTGDASGFVPGSTDILPLLARLPGSWDAVSFETSDGRGIEVAFIWDTARVTLLDGYQMSGPDVEAWFGPSSPSAGREPLVGVFDIRGHEVTIVGNHFKSKGGDDALYYDFPPSGWLPDRVTEFQRKGQAQTVRNFVDGILDSDPGALVMVTGDLNDFAFSEPGEGPDNPVAILEGINSGVPLANLINLEKPSETWTFVFDGNAQVLDHMLVSPAMLDYVVAADVLHFNTTTPTLMYEDDATTGLSASDHDPVEGRFMFD